MRIFITGATGFVGRMVVARLLGEGNAVVAWCRNPQRARDLLGAEVEVVSPVQDSSLIDGLRGCDAAINLQGENVMGRRWSKRQKQHLVDSRVAFTHELADAMQQLGDSGPRTLVSASAVGYYGAQPVEEVDEDSPAGDDFLATLCRDWETAALRAEQFGVRVVILRIGLVLGAGGGALGRLQPLFQLGLGGRLGTGEQPVSWIHLSDLVSLVCTSLSDERYVKSFNATSPHLVDNDGLTKALARVLGKPSIFAVPAAALRVVLGEAASVLLGGQRAVPKRALSLGFRFEHSELDLALGSLLVNDSISIQPAKNNRDADFLLEVETIVDAPTEEVFSFFSRAENLGAMTPSDLRFSIQGSAPEQIREGTEIAYDIGLGAIPMGWVSRIERWVPGASFVDRQLRGPYAHWWHEHAFEPLADNKTLMRDRVFYRLPLGPIGRAAHALFVRAKLKKIFAFRKTFTDTRFHRDRQRQQLARSYA